MNKSYRRGLEKETGIEGRDGEREGKGWLLHSLQQKYEAVNTRSTIRILFAFPGPRNELPHKQVGQNSPVLKAGGVR